MLILRYLPSLFFALALLFAQQGSALHTLQHAFAEQTQQQHKQSPHTKDCEHCTSYLQLGSALNSSFLSFDLCTSLVQVFAQNYSVFFTRHTLTAIARGPPVFQRSV